MRHIGIFTYDPDSTRKMNALQAVAGAGEQQQIDSSQLFFIKEALELPALCVLVFP